MDDDMRPLDQASPYYRWGEYKGRLCIESECCADSFSKEEELALLSHLAQKHGKELR